MRPTARAPTHPIPTLGTSSLLVAALLVGPAAWADANLARGARVRQSSLAHDGVPERAVDGNPNGHYPHGSVTHTQNGGLNWLELDLGRSQPITTVVVHNRTDCCAERLSGARVEVGAEPCDRFVRRWSMGLPPVTGATPATRTALDFGGVEARYVCVRLDTGLPLSVAEIEVYGRGGAPSAAAAQVPAALVGTYRARHPHWSGSVTLRADGSYARENGDPGTWSFDGRVLTLAWQNWGAERLTDRGGGRYVAESNGFELMRDGSPPAPPRPTPVVNPPVVNPDTVSPPVVTPTPPPAPPRPAAPTDCGAGPGDTGCGLTRDGAAPMGAAEFKVALQALRGERNEITRRELLDTLIGASALTARQFTVLLNAFDGELQRLDVARAHADRVVNPKEAIPAAKLFRNSFSRQEFIELMSR